MSLLRTKHITEGCVLAFTGVPPAEGDTFLWGNARDFDLRRGDVVKVLEINRRDGSPWARVIVAVLLGGSCGRIGQVSINMDARVQRSWQRLTTTGSMEPVRVIKKPQADSPAESGVRHAYSAPTDAAPQAQLKSRSGG